MTGCYEKVRLIKVRYGTGLDGCPVILEYGSK